MGQRITFSLPLHTAAAVAPSRPAGYCCCPQTETETTHQQLSNHSSFEISLTLLQVTLDLSHFLVKPIITQEHAALKYILHYFFKYLNPSKIQRPFLI